MERDVTARFVGWFEDHMPAKSAARAQGQAKAKVKSR